MHKFKKGDERRSNAFELWCWRRMLHVSWRERKAFKQLGVNDGRRRKARKRKTRTETNGMDRQHRDIDDRRNARSTQRSEERKSGDRLVTVQTYNTIQTTILCNQNHSYITSVLTCMCLLLLFIHHFSFYFVSICQEK